VSSTQPKQPFRDRLHRRLQDLASTLLEAYHSWFDPLTPANILAANKIAEERVPEDNSTADS
jgi:hypothetical protein